MALKDENRPTAFLKLPESRMSSPCNAKKQAHPLPTPTAAAQGRESKHGVPVTLLLTVQVSLS